MGHKILIIGGSISGIACADHLGNNNEIWVIEKTQKIGGMSSSYSCKATDKCNYCGWCLTNEVLKHYKQSQKPNIKLLLNTNLLHIQKKGESFSAKLQTQDKNEKKTFSEKFDKVIIAYGSHEYDAREKPRFGYKKYKNVLTGYDIEQDLRKRDFSKTPEIAFIQCVGARDESIGATYCSKVCCRYALRMANYILFKYPNTKITVYYMDMQVQGKDIKGIYKDLKRDERVSFVRGIPSYITEDDNKKLSIRFEDTVKQKSREDIFDLVVLSVGLSPNRDNGRLSRMLGINLGMNGFITTDDNYMTNIEGVYAIGTSTSPVGINASLESSEKVVKLI